ncbi:putative serine/threonine protein kinase IRE4 [Hibiscus syriacus]|uniref:non-specific serine/threonine protein kinase n=1 Tax=Hibiscus syriacus TaxID=106335 RepID=A0A6A2XXG0_HIBSY|nr:putative serine/threonine protein kinase IRE4 [Hibiscus syriacus]
MELATFAADVMDFLQTINSSPPEGRKMAEDLFYLAQQCVQMTSSEFRVRCETIVQALTEKRQQCQTVLVKWLCTRVLFILTRCTRVLQFQKEKEPIDENSMIKFKKCLESIPAVETSWVLASDIADSYSANAMYQRVGGEKKLQGQSEVSLFPKPAVQRDITSGKDSTIPEKISATQGSQPDFTSHERPFCQADGNFPEQTLDGSDSVICRICEEAVPISHLESHSYICAYADKCALNCIDVDERLVNLAEILEQIIESRNLNSIGSPENPRMQNLSSAVTSEGYSPKISEWRNKGVEGMFEDIHEMDTASIEDSHLASIDFKGHLGMRLGNYGASSSTGSMTSQSSNNTPRGSHFDSFWLEHNNLSELEDVQQMVDLSDIAHCVAGTDLSKEGSHELLLACMQDLQDILRHSKLKTLVIDTFRGRIETLMRDNLYLVMEYLNGGDLYSLLRKFGCLDEEVARTYIAELVGRTPSYLICVVPEMCRVRESVTVKEGLAPLNRPFERTFGSLISLYILIGEDDRPQADRHRRHCRPPPAVAEKTKIPPKASSQPLQPKTEAQTPK